MMYRIPIFSEEDAVPDVAEAPSSADEVADAAVRRIRRYVNSELFEAAQRRAVDGARQYEFMCECGRLRCRERVTMPLASFDPGSPPGAVVAHV